MFQTKFYKVPPVSLKFILVMPTMPIIDCPFTSKAALLNEIHCYIIMHDFMKSSLLFDLIFLLFDL